MTDNELEEVVEFLAATSKDPYAFALGAFDWDSPELRGRELEPWQVWVLEAVRDGLCDLSTAIQIAVTSGHGIGKSALVAILVLWGLSTFEDSRGIVTANTENQLKTKTWVEVATWFRRFIGKSLFKMSATSIVSADPAHSSTWRCDMVPWSERNTEAFAGMHNAGKRIFVIFDEASAIPDIIHEVMEGALTDEDTEILWLMAGNPTRNKGRFREAHAGGRFAHRWLSRAVDSREVSFTNKEQIKNWIKDYGEDSDFVRIRVKGQFPRVDAVSFIPYEAAVEATRLVPPRSNHQYVIGVDVGRFGDDPSVIYPRCGADAVTVPPKILRGADGPTVARHVADMFHSLRARVIFVDEGGVGASVVDHLRIMRLPVVAVQFGSKPLGLGIQTSNASYANRRAEMWGLLRDWIVHQHGCIPLNVDGNISMDGAVQTLVDELTGPTYHLNAQDAIQLEKKSDMKKRGVPSPNVADALALTHAESDILPHTPDGFWTLPAAPPSFGDFDPFSISQELH